MTVDLSGFPGAETLVRQATACLMDVKTTDTPGAAADLDAIYTMCFSVQCYFEDVDFEDSTRSVTELCIAQAILSGLVFAAEEFACGAGQVDALSWAAVSLLKLALFLVSQEVTEYRAQAVSEQPVGLLKPAVKQRANRQAVTA